ncbi:LysR family transcriptional regulator [Ideonella livida]|uniref:LysR family transcriptional regulator n=1 Tax=Ideonella livida TaxID=2707176 RepID=A0A7C9TNL6_9BURK|nr:LysR family transcriptional regulator [Ideonella livida]NDY94003.1 LysR family transcriptional regulator [Ideonella livida]
MKNLTLRQLEVFAALADSGSRSAAAERLGISQPAVSMLMRQLQDDVGLPLWQGAGRRVELTGAGQFLLGHARTLQEQMRRLEEGLAGLRDGAQGHLHLGVVPTAHYWAPQLLLAFQQRHPGTRFKLSVGPRAQVLDWLKSHRIDVAIGGHPPGEADVEATAFARHPHGIVAAAGHRLASAGRIGWSQLREEPFLFREEGSATRSFLEHLLQGQALQVNARIELSGNETVKQAVMAGMGISFMSVHAVQVELQARRLVLLEVQGMPKWLDWCLIQRREAQPAAVVAQFREFVLAQGQALVASHSLLAAT